MTKSVERWDYFELELQATTSGNPFTDITLEADFSHNQRTARITGFYDGGDMYRIRFMPDLDGSWLFVTYCNVNALDDLRGDFERVPPTDKNHGSVRVIDHAHFAYSDRHDVLRVELAGRRVGRAAAGDVESIAIQQAAHVCLSQALYVQRQRAAVLSV